MSQQKLNDPPAVWLAIPRFRPPCRHWRFSDLRHPKKHRQRQRAWRNPKSLAVLRRGYLLALSSLLIIRQMQVTRFNPDDFPDSPYAQQLRRKTLPLHFPPILEAAFTRVHLDEVRTRTRFWTVLALILALGFAARQLLMDHGWSSTIIIQSLVIVPVDLSLFFVVWTPLYSKWYLPSASFLAPLSGAGIAGVVAIAVTAGEPGRLAMITLFLMAAFFFMGLLLRSALATSLLTLLSFFVSGSFAGMPENHLLASTGFLLIAALLSAVIAWQTEVASRRRFLEVALIEELVDRDCLTGLKNRRAFDEHLTGLWQQSLRNDQHLAILFFDVDYFKHYNDEYGHQAGDLVLRRIAQAAEKYARRPLDFAARFGGEEFAVVLYDVDENTVGDIAERLRSAVEQLCIDHSRSRCAEVVTISIGAGIVRPEMGRTPQGLLQLCDEALYKAKARGRNRCVIDGQAEYDGLITGVYRNASIKELR